jgi:hypothetical protein
MNSISLASLPIHLLITGGALAALAVAFIVFFCIPGIRHQSRLKVVLADLRLQDEEANPKKLGDVFIRDSLLAHLWEEYRKSLHEERSEQGGISRVTRWRSTLPAEVFWNPTSVVDGRLGTEFFKHMPGILTGLGIIGTFSGLIDGLQKFQVSEKPEAVRLGLEGLMHSVGEAFLISASAITAAMVFTFIEKLLLTSLYGKTEEIAQAIDSRFKSGAGEDYLGQLAKSSETSASQLKILKDSLISDLKTVLATDLKAVLQEISSSYAAAMQSSNLALQSKLAEASREQIDASRDDSQALGGVIAGAISDGLAKPLEEIKEAVRVASSDQSAVAIQMLQDVMVSFSEKLNQMFGGQISGINELNQRTAQTMETAVQQLHQLVANLNESGARTSQTMADQMAKALADLETRQGDITNNTQALVQELRSAIEQAQKTTAQGLEASGKEMAERMATAIEAMALRQDSINERTGAFVEQIKRLVDTSQDETSAKMQSTLQALGEQVGGMLEQLRESQRSSLDQSRKRDEAVADTTRQAVSIMTKSVETVVAQMGEASAKMQDSVAALARVTTSSISGMNDGAEQLNNHQLKLVGLDCGLKVRIRVA